MTVCNVITTADNILNLNIVSQLDVSAQTLAQAMRHNADCNLLLTCCNSVMEDLFRQFAFDCRSTVVEAVNGLIDTSLLKICRAVSLTDSAGRKTPFAYCASGLKVDADGKYNLTYARLPDELDFDTDVTLPNCKITNRIFTYGVIAEYLRIVGDYLNSQSWLGKFNQALTVATTSKTDLRLPSRRWLT